MVVNGKQLRVGIAGYGVVGNVRREFIDLHPGMRTVAVCDRTFGGTGHLDDGTSYFENFEMLLECDMDALFVCLSNDLAASVTIAGLERGLHVFCEKPPARTPDELEAVIACEKAHAGQHLMYGFNHRYHDSVREALTTIRSGELGRLINIRGVYGKSKIINFESDWRTQRAIAGGGILLDQGIHMVDLIRLFGGEFDQVKSFLSNDYWKHDVEDNAYALLKSSESGVVALLHSSATQWRHRFNMELSLEEGAIVLSGLLTGSKSYGAETITVARKAPGDQGDPVETLTRYNSDPSWQREVAAFYTAVAEQKGIENGSSKEAMKTIRLVYEIYRADEEWKRKWNL